MPRVTRQLARSVSWRAQGLFAVTGILVSDHTCTWARRGCDAQMFRSIACIWGGQAGDSETSTWIGSVVARPMFPRYSLALFPSS